MTSKTLYGYKRSSIYKSWGKTKKESITYPKAWEMTKWNSWCKSSSLSIITDSHLESFVGMERRGKRGKGPTQRRSSASQGLSNLMTSPVSTLLSSWLLKEPCNQIVTKLCVSATSSSSVIAARPLNGENSQTRLGKPKPGQVRMAHPLSLWLTLPSRAGAWAFILLSSSTASAQDFPQAIYHGTGGRRCRQKSSLVLMWSEEDD